MSAASAIGDHIRTWLITGSPENDFVSLAVPSDGSYVTVDHLFCVSGPVERFESDPEPCFLHTKRRSL
jgi:hypothetical protein